MSCLFCKIIKGEIPCKKIYEDDQIFAFHDINPQAPVHVLIISKKHISGIPQLVIDDDALIGKIMRTAHKIAQQLNVADQGYRVVVNSGRNAGQEVFHIHFHLLGGRSMNWPPG
ncbi:histidine triad nucleotide-binding protein [bacterium]|nr:histidine triad nucleotide-binding protein [bacterium]